MENYGKTSYYAQTPNNVTGQQITVFDAGLAPYTLDLGSFGKQVITFGREQGNDIILRSPLVSRQHHGEFVRENGVWLLRDTGSTNGILYNGQRITGRYLSDGDLFRIDRQQPSIEGVLFVVSGSDTPRRWRTVPIGNGLSIGRDPNSSIVLPHISVSQRHAVIAPENGGYVIYDTRSTNGILVNGVRVNGKARLNEKDVIVITNTRLIFTGGSISYCRYDMRGISVDTSNVVIVRTQRGKKLVTCRGVSLDIRPGELVAIIGGSGAGKSTVLNAMCGYLRPASGSVYINGVDLYANFDSLKKLIGYVPQSDIVYDNLTLYDMLSYAAKLRLPKDATPKDREDAITRAIATVELTEKRGALIKNLSGGQRKRASIAVELLSDPNLLFLDEPASGLDPGTERNLMHSLRQMADSGKTVILVTHSTLQLALCDKVVFMGKNGYLCFCGPLHEALSFFGVKDVVDVYNMITLNSEEWSRRYAARASHPAPAAAPLIPPKRTQEDLFGQLGVLCSRYFKLIINDRQRLILLVAQAPLLGLLISFVANGDQFEQYDITKSLLFALSCSAFWIGILNSIQEICKERTILKREYMTGLRLDSYILSKLAVLAALAGLQSLLLTGTFAALVGLPEEGLFAAPLIELFITVFLTALASAAMGLFVSALFTNPDRAMTVAPILLMPQILFSGIIFTLEGATELISWLAVCRWSMEGLGSSSQIIDMPMRISYLPHPDTDEKFFDATTSHLMATWFILIAFVVIFSALAWFSLRSIKDDKS